VAVSLTIGDFARTTHLSVKTLRYYHRIGLLAPAAIDPDTGYRRYQTDQIPVAQVIRRFRALEMPLEEIGAILAAPDVAARNHLIAAHLRRLEASLERTQQATASLRSLLETQTPMAPADLAHRSVTATSAAAITATIDVADVEAWYNGALGELYASLASQNIEVLGPAGGIFSNDVFTEHRGEATVFVPCNLTLRRAGDHHSCRVASRHRPRLRRARNLCRRARTRYRRAHPRVLPRQPPHHRRRVAMANRDRLADLQYGTSCLAVSAS
jgi:DNA-binding transcriptional MerR regulator